MDLAVEVRIGFRLFVVERPTTDGKHMFVADITTSAGGTLAFKGDLSVYVKRDAANTAPRSRNPSIP